MAHSFMKNLILIMQQYRNNKKMKINHKQVSKLNSFNGVKLRGNETFTELLEIEKDRKERIALDNANIQRVDAQIYKHKK